MEQNKFYVYVHFRKSDGIPFYVGKGSGGRAWENGGRNRRWIRTKNKHGIIISIWYTNLNEDTAFKEEIKLIKSFRSIYGKKIANITDGGEGFSQQEKVRRNQQRVLKWLKKNNRLPKSSVETERKIFSHMHVYINRRYNYSKEIHELALSFGLRKNNAVSKKQRLLELMVNENRLPYPGSTLSSSLHNYINPNSSAYDSMLREVWWNFTMNNTEVAIDDSV